MPPKPYLLKQTAKRHVSQKTMQSAPRRRTPQAQHCKNHEFPKASQRNEADPDTRQEVSRRGYCQRLARFPASRFCCAKRIDWLVDRSEMKEACQDYESPVYQCSQPGTFIKLIAAASAKLAGLVASQYAFMLKGISVQPGTKACSRMHGKETSTVSSRHLKPSSQQNTWKQQRPIQKEP